MQKVCYGCVDVADYRETESNLYPSRKKVDDGNIQNDYYTSISECFH